MPTWLSVAGTLALFAMCLSATRLGPGWKAWPRFDRINYVVLSVACWPYLLTGIFTTQPRWYTITAAAVFAASVLAFFTQQVRFLREGRELIARAQTAAAELERHQDGGGS